MNQNTWMGRACGYRILLQTEGLGPLLASDDRVLLQMTASRFRRPRFASDGRILLQTIAFCFRWPRFASDGRILLWTAALWARIERNNITSHFPQAREWVKGASEQMSAAECASEASSVEQANEWAARVNERTDKRVAQFSNLYSWLFWPTVRCILLRRAAFCVTQPWSPLDHRSKLQKKSILHCAMNNMHWHCRKTSYIHITVRCVY